MNVGVYVTECYPCAHCDGSGAQKNPLFEDLEGYEPYLSLCSRCYGSGVLTRMVRLDETELWRNRNESGVKQEEAGREAGQGL